MKSSPEILHKNKKPRKASQSPWSIRIINIQGGWVVVKGASNTPISAVFNTREDAKASLQTISPPFPPATGAVPWTPKQIREYDLQQRNQLPQALL
jgi:hypothetical protein